MRHCCLAPVLHNVRALPQKCSASIEKSCLSVRHRTEHSWDRMRNACACREVCESFEHPTCKHAQGRGRVVDDMITRATKHQNLRTCAVLYFSPYRHRSTSCICTGTAACKWRAAQPDPQTNRTVVGHLPARRYVDTPSSISLWELTILDVPFCVARFKYELRVASRNADLRLMMNSRGSGRV